MAVEYGFNSAVLCEVWVSVCVWGGGGEWSSSRPLVGLAIVQTHVRSLDLDGLHSSSLTGSYCSLLYCGTLPVDVQKLIATWLYQN